MREKAKGITDYRCENKKVAALTRFCERRFGKVLLFAIGCASNLGSRAHGQTVDIPAKVGSQVELTWVAPAGCPDQAWVNSEIERLLGRPLNKVKEPRTKAAATVTEMSSGKWGLKLVTLQNNTGGERELRAEQCQPLARATALILALSVDPKAVAAVEKEATEKVEGVQETGSQNPADTNKTAAPPPPPTAPQQNAPSKEEPAPKVEVAPQEEPAPKAEPSPVSPPAAEKTAENTTEKTAEKRSEEPPSPLIATSEDTAKETPRYSVALGAHGIGDMGSLLKISGGGGINAAIMQKRWSFEAIANMWPSRQTRVDTAAGYGAKLALWTIAPGACYRVWTRGLSLAPCVHVELGRMYGQGTNLTNWKKGAVFWLAPLASARVTWPVDGPAGIVAELGCAIPVLRPRFKLEINDLGVEVHRSAIVAPRARVGAELRF